ncbi:MAG: DUF805 domain-containing protein [Muribaculaceae bacterium]|nr:DUF805 domain-containing protein [Muribaculaceae bacterium]
MFARWYKFSGRIGRLEYVLTLVIAVVLYFFVLLGVGQLLQAMGITIESNVGLYIFTLGAMLPSVYLMLAAGIKRTHDTRVSVWYALIPVIVALCLMLGIIPGLIPILIGIAGCVYLFKDAGEDGVNEHGSNPVQPYAEQLNFEEA